MWPITTDIAYYKRLSQVDADSTYFEDMLPLLLEHINDECTQTFEANTLPANVKLFLAQAISFFHGAQYGVTGEKMGSVSFSYNFSNLPATLTDLLSQYGYGRKRNGARFHVL